MIRVGILGAARIAPAALVRPARAVDGVEVVAVAARDVDRAHGFAQEHGVPRVVRSYEELVADDGVDAVYNPLPNGLHGRWTKAALSAGKHVLCEKPFTANAAEAREVVDAAAAAGVVVMEAFHYRYHPLFARALALLDDGVIGPVRRIDTWVCFPLLRRGDIRWRLELAGGATMDAGCYALHMVRHLARAEPEVSAARARLLEAEVDRALVAELRFADGRVARATCSMLSARLLHVAARVRGDEGELHILNPLAPQAYHRLRLRASGRRAVEHVTRRPSYEFQLRAFVESVERKVPPVTGPHDAVANMALIDDVYRAAGLSVRTPTP